RTRSESATNVLVGWAIVVSGRWSVVGEHESMSGRLDSSARTGNALPGSFEAAELFPFRFGGEDAAVIFGGTESPGRRFGHHDRTTRMKLEGRGRDHCGDRTFDGFGNDFRLCGARGQEQATAAFQDRPDPHRDCPARDPLRAAE